jgi:transcriptional regulator with XRE-family HTH domain
MSVTETQPSELLIERRRLATALQQLREAAGLTTYQLANQLGVSQSKVSKIENARVAVRDVDTVDAWARATGASPEKTRELVERAELALTEAVSWRSALREGLPVKQRQVGELERAATLVRVFQLAVIPGLLQTADYARRMFLGHYPAGRPDIGAAVAARLERQAVLYDETKRFEFILTEAVLRWRVGPVPMMLAQLDRLRSLATLPNVAVGIIPLAVEMPGWHGNAFTLFEFKDDEDENSLVHVELLTSWTNVSDPNDVGAYREAFQRLRDAAVFDEPAQALLAAIMDDLRASAGGSPG